MSKSSGGGGLKGHDKGSAGTCKVVKNRNGPSLENGLDMVQDVLVYEHPDSGKQYKLKLHNGNKKEGPLTCDGPDDICCGRDGDGVIHVGEPRYSCAEEDFDICPTCVAAETEEELTPEQQKQRLREKLREKTRRPGGRPAADKPAAADKSAAAATGAPESAGTLEARRAEVAAKVAAARKERADNALLMAIGSGNLDALKAALQDHADHASEDVVSEARKTRDRLSQKAKKAAQKARKASEEAGAAEAPAVAMMVEPVILSDGHTYERKAVEKYLEAADVSPRTGEKLAHKSVLPNLMALELVKLAGRLDFGDE